MDRPNNTQDLFSRGATPPDPQFTQRQPFAQQPGQPPQPPQQQQQQQQQPPNAQAPNVLDALFHGLGGPAASNQQQLPSFAPGQAPNTEPITPLSLLDEAPPKTSSMPTTTAAERDKQNAILNMLGPVNSPPMGSGQTQFPPIASSQNITQIPTPPAGTTSSEAQGKLLLEQLMSGTQPPRSNYPESQPRPLASGASPPYTQPNPPAEDTYHGREPSYATHDTSRETAPRLPPPEHTLPQVQPPSLPPPPPIPPPQQQQPGRSSPPSRKSMFDFVSPFDALAATKKKPVPPSTDISSSGNEDWTSVPMSADPRRKSVDNLMDTLGGPVPPMRGGPISYEHFTSTEEIFQPDSSQNRGPIVIPQPPLAQKPPLPSSSPPKPSVARQRDSPVGQALTSVPASSARRDNKESPRGGWKGAKGLGAKVKNQPSPTSLHQNIVFDVSLPLDEIQAPQESVKSTPIALVKQDSLFLPGTTIGATHWVAYAMTRGRVRVISRSSGDRTLLQLPSPFPSSSSVTDMAVHGNRLAGVTSDGGFVVWELPEVITDDVPGQQLLCIPPTPEPDGFHSVKWHPKQPDMLAVASQTTIYLIDLVDASRIWRGQPISYNDLSRISQLFSVTSRVIAFDFDVPHFAIATISEDSTLTLWNIRDKLSFWNHQVRGEDLPSSLTFIDGGIVIGRKNGTIFQLLSVTTKNVLSTIKFVNETEDPGMFGHANYDARIQTLWIANNRRDSMIALKFGFDPSLNAADENRVYLEQVVEFVGPKPTIHFVILTGDLDPNGEEAHAACLAAKVTPGELALVAFSVHSGGVDQILIRKEWCDSALAMASSKFPSSAAVDQPRGLRGLVPLQASPNMPQSTAAAQIRSRTPPSEDVEGDYGDTRSDANRKAKGSKNLAWKDTQDNGPRHPKEQKLTDSPLVVDTSLLSLTKEIRKTEESLHTRIGRLIGKEMDKQHQRLEDARAKDQAEDFARQEKILKLISNELTRNTTRVVEMAVKSEVQNSVLPALGNITQAEVKAALNEQIGKGLTEFIQQRLPLEIEKLLLRSDISAHFAHILSTNVAPLLERNIKEAVNKTFLALLSQQTAAVHQELLRELRSEILNVKKEVFGVQSESFRSQEALIRDLEHTVRTLTEQVKFLSMNAPSVPLIHHHAPPNRGSPVGGVQHAQGNMSQLPLRQQAVAPTSANYGQNYPQQSQPPAMTGSWFPTAIAAPQASHPAAPPPPTTHAQRTPPAKQEEWDDAYLAVLGTQDAHQMRELLARSNPDVVMPLNSPGPLSQAVILALLHRLALAIGETPPADEFFKSALWWLQRTVASLNTNDPIIAPYIARVVPNVQQTLNTTKQRLSIIPGAPQLQEAARTISEVQDTLSRKPM